MVVLVIQTNNFTYSAPGGHGNIGRHLFFFPAHIPLAVEKKTACRHATV